MFQSLAEIINSIWENNKRLPAIPYAPLMTMMDSVMFPNPNEQTVDDKMPKGIYLAIDWERCLIGGSYALKQYLNKNSYLAQWEPSDVDIFGVYKNFEEFNAECKKFQEKAGLELIKEVYNDVEKITVHITGPQVELNNNNNSSENKNSNDDFVEDFDYAIIGTKTYVKKDFAQKIQMVGFNAERVEKERPGTQSLLELLDKITDLPACICYTVSDDQKIFYVPLRAIEPLKTGMINYSAICSKRIDKYAKRGFQFCKDQNMQL